MFAIRSFHAGDTVIVGVIERRVERNHSHATQVGPLEYVELSGAGPMVNHSCDPNCGIRVNEGGAPDLVARRLIAVGEEVTFDYAMRNHSIEHFPVPLPLWLATLPHYGDRVEGPSRGPEDRVPQPRRAVLAANGK